MEVLAVVVQLLGYDVSIQNQSGENITLVAEEAGKTHPCKYIRVSKDQNGKGEITFEHFESQSDLEKEKVKFAALAQKLGVKIVLPDSPITGKPVQGSIREKESQPEHIHSHGHHHHNHGKE